MRNSILVALLACTLVAPAGAFAQAPPRPAPAPTPIAVSDQVVSINAGQWLAIGAGAIAGAVLLDVVLPARIAYILGGVAGGYLGYMWYSGYQPEVRLVPTPKS